LLRTPLSPGKVDAGYSESLRIGEKVDRFHQSSLVVLVTDLPGGVRASPWILPVVDQVEPLLTLTGKPLDQRGQSRKPPAANERVQPALGALAEGFALCRRAAR